MRLKLYRAADTAKAMARVRAELGPDALILSSRRVADGVEVTAALEHEPPPVAVAPPRPADPPPPPPRPAPLDPLHAALAWHGVPAGLVRRLEAGPLPFALSAALRFGHLPLAPGGRPVLLVGPPGAGKTLTAARLATRLVMTGIAPLVVTTDGKRAGAAEQLAAFTRLLDLQLLVASAPVALARALARRVDRAPVLIDTAGTDPFDPAQCEELAALAATADAEIAVVLPAGLDVGEATDLAGAYAGCGGTLLVATRLDLSRRLGGVLAAAAEGLMPAEAGIGPGAADGLVPLTPDLLARRLMRVPEAPPARTGTRSP
jgi:flagellar biosynthesis protein FlhF